MLFSPYCHRFRLTAIILACYTGGRGEARGVGPGSIPNPHHSMKEVNTLTNKNENPILPEGPHTIRTTLEITLHEFAQPAAIIGLIHWIREAIQNMEAVKEVKHVGTEDVLD
jgi:hypothetical protein